MDLLVHTDHREPRPRSDPRAGAVDAGRFDPRFARPFAWYVEHRMFARRFHAVRLAKEHAGLLSDAAGHPGPVLVLLNHPSWWDPLVAVLLARRFMPRREPLAPIDAAMLRTFGFFRRLGVFGIDPDDPASLRAMADHIAARLAAHPRTTVWITPQGRLTDARAEVRIRPGAAAIAAARPDVRVIAAAVEYIFWGHPRPEVLIRLEPCETDGPGAGRTAAWQRAMLAAMRRNAAALTALATARDPAPFDVLVGREEGRAGRNVNPLYDLWLRLRGRSAGITHEQALRKARAGPTGRIGPRGPMSFMSRTEEGATP